MNTGFNILRLKSHILILCILLIFSFKGYSQVEILYPFDNHGRIKAELYPDSINIKYTHDAVGNIITKIVENPCSEKPTPQIFPSGKILICKGDSVQLTAPIGLGYTWTSGDTSRSIWIKKADIYTVEVKLTSSCIRTSFPDTILFRTQNLKILTADSFFCPGFKASLTSSLNGTYKWSTGDSIKTIFADTSKKYFLYFKDSTGCRDTVSIITGFYSKPKASFITPGLCPGIAGYCLNTSIITNDSMTYLWSFGDNTPLSPTPYHAYAISGSYPVKLVATSSKGCKDSVINTLIVDRVPISGFSINDTSQCIKYNSFIFNDTTKTVLGISRMWSFGDGSNDTVRIKYKSFNSVGSYSVKLVVSSMFGCKDSTSRNVTVKATPLMSTIVGKANPHTDSSYMYSISSTAGSLYVWSTNKGTIKTGNGTNNITIKWDSISGNGWLKVVELNNKGCYSDTSILNIAVVNSFNFIVTPPSLKFVNSISTKRVAVISNMSWNAVASHPWFYIDKFSGIGNDSVSITVLQNQNISSRTGTVVFTADTLQKTIAVIQDSVPPDFLVLNIDSIISPFTGSNSPIFITSNRSWVVNSNQTWAAVSPTFGNNNGVMNIIVQSNGGPERYAVITVTGGFINKTVAVKQNKYATGVYDYDLAHLVSIYPNPSTGIINIDLESIPDKGELKVYNVLGELVFSKQLITKLNQLNFEGFSKGLYFIMISTDQSNFNSKVLIR